jgi:hypothetical protein
VIITGSSDKPTSFMKAELAAGSDGVGCRDRQPERVDAAMVETTPGLSSPLAVSTTWAPDDARFSDYDPAFRDLDFSRSK